MVELWPLPPVTVRVAELTPLARLDGSTWTMKEAGVVPEEGLTVAHVAEDVTVAVVEEPSLIDTLSVASLQLRPVW